MNEISFSGTGKINGNEVELLFKGNDVTIDFSDESNPKFIIKLIPNKENETWYELKSNSNIIKEGK
jgi:hypothetical protein